MSDIVRDIPGKPIIRKVAETLDKNIADPRAATNYVRRIYDAYKELTLNNIKEKREIVTRNKTKENE